MLACPAGGRSRARRTCRSPRLISISLRSYCDTIFASWSIAATSTRLCADPSVCAPDGFFIVFRARRGTDVMTVNKRAFVYPAGRIKESVMSRRHSCPARPYADIMKRNSAVRSYAVVADEDVDTPAVEEL